MEKLKQQLGVKLILLLIAITLVGFGASGLVQSRIGGDAVLVFEQGISVFLKLEFGITIMIINLIFTVILFFVNKKMINIGTIVFILFLGPIVSLFDKLSVFPDPNTFMESLGIFFISAIVVTFGISVYLYTDVGYTAFEGILIEIKDRTKIRFSFIKITSDAILFIVGILLGGTFGWGSAISVILFGPLIDMFMYFLKKSNIIKKTSI